MFSIYLGERWQMKHKTPPYIRIAEITFLVPYHGNRKKMGNFKIVKYTDRHTARKKEEMYLGRKEIRSFYSLAFCQLWNHDGRQTLSSFLTQPFIPFIPFESMKTHPICLSPDKQSVPESYSMIYIFTRQFYIKKNFIYCFNFKTIISKLDEEA